MKKKHFRPGKDGLWAMGAILILVLALPALASAVPYRSRTQEPSPLGSLMRMGDFTVRVSTAWEKESWVRDGTQKGWRLRYRSGRGGNRTLPMSLNFSNISKACSTLDQVRAEQERLKIKVKNSYPKGYLATETTLAGETALVLRYYNRGGTLFLILPRQGMTLREIYVWVGEEVREMPLEIQEVLSTLTLPGQPAFEPTAP